jgi:hypothetical protein
LSVSPLAFTAIVLLVAALVIWVARDVSARPELTGGQKALWIVGALLAPVLVALLYLLVGRRSRRA